QLGVRRVAQDRRTRHISADRHITLLFPHRNGKRAWRFTTMRRKLTEAMQAAQKARDSERLATLRLILAAIKDRDIAHRGSGRPPGEDSGILEVLARMVRQRKESAKAYEEGGRPERAAQERREIDIIEAFLPEPMSEEEIAAAAASAIEEAEAAGPA